MTVRELGAFVDLSGGDSDPERTLHFSVAEFAVLRDGRRLTLHEERGWSTSTHRAFPLNEPLPSDWDEPLDPWLLTTREDLVHTALNVVLPDDDDDPDEHPYEWLCELLAAQGVDASVDELRAVPYVVELSRALEERLAELEAGRR
jgi:hypothetical protein